MRHGYHTMRKYLATFGWVWGVCFLATWGAMGFIKVAEKSTDVHGWSLAIFALVVTIPMAFLITLAVVLFRASISGTAYEKRLMSVKGLRIGFVSMLVGLAGFAEEVAFGTGLGEIVFWGSFIGVAIGGAVHAYEMFRGVRA
jgi:hypothetical protein